MSLFQKLSDNSYYRTLLWSIAASVVAFAGSASFGTWGWQPKRDILQEHFRQHASEISAGSLTLSVTLIGFSMTVATMASALGLLPAAEKLHSKDDWPSLPRVMMLPVWMFMTAAALAIVTLIADAFCSKDATAPSVWLLGVISVSVGGAVALGRAVSFQAGLFSFTAKHQQHDSRDRDRKDINESADDKGRAASRRT